MKFERWGYAIPIALLLVDCFLLAAQAQDSAWLQQNRRKSPDRYEGLLDQPNARREFDVLALHAYTSAGQVKIPSAEYLEVAYCRPSATTQAETGSQPAFIEVRQLAGRVNYLMKSAPQAPPAASMTGWQKFVWPASEVIQSHHIDPNRLGAVVHLGDDNEYAEKLEPAVFAASHGEHGDAPSGPIESYDLILRVRGRSLNSLSYSFHTPEGPAITCRYENEFQPCATGSVVNQVPIESGSLVRLKLDLKGARDSEVTVHIEGAYENSDDRLIANFHFAHVSICR